MNITNRAKHTASLSGFAALAVLLGPAADMTSATPRTAATPRPAAVAAQAVEAPRAADEAPLPTLTAQTSVSSVRAAQEFRVFGASRHLPPGTPVSLQQQQGTRWVDLPASVRTTPQGTYSMRVVLGIEGRNALRVTGGGAVSPVVYVTVEAREERA
ncbi:hypothetical protein [Streptomyces alboniger]|uniref:Uncharacterized protein n=1 Tax=Streptomyces alboniger TaxID=132473 RepID=A0A5J6HRH6_STRAD|nr:hypothetical protein [Streptomyces alboniger]QEV21454.1 hypothetical protein CP975_31435 [Streptomyces alboniger]